MRLGSRAWAVVAVAAASVAIVSVPTGRATPSFSFTRLAGADRYATAATIADETHGASPVAVLTTGERFPDALSGGFVAGLSSAPILLSRHGTVPQATLDALQSLGTARVVIVGGTDAVAASVESDLRGRGYVVERVAGVDRYDTAAKAAAAAGPAGPGSVAGARTAVVASGENFPDALASGPLAYASRVPILLTPKSSLADAARQSLSSLAIQQVLIPGGVDAVSADVQQAIEQMDITVVRVAGADRTDTAARLADWAIANAGFSTTHANLARGDDFADALAGGPHGGSDGPAPILLTTNPTTIGTATRAWFTAHAATLASGHIFGGVGAVSQAAEQDATAAARSGSSPSSTSTTVATPSPFFTGASADANTTTITVTYDEPIACDSVDVDGSVYIVTISTGPGSPVTASATAAACAGAPMFSDTVTITVPAAALFRSGQTGRVDVKKGTDGNTVRDVVGREQVLGNWVPFTIT